MATQDELDGLLSTSSAWLKEIEAGRFENLEKAVDQHNQSVMDYMQGKDIRTLAKPQQEKLYRLLSNQKTAIKIVSDEKQQLARKLTELRNGRNLKNTYNNNSL